MKGSGGLHSRGRTNMDEVGTSAMDPDNCELFLTEVVLPKDSSLVVVIIEKGRGGAACCF